jgi:hypothetical protein
MRRTGESVKVEFPNRYCGRETRVKWEYPSNCQHSDHTTVTDE